MTSGHSYALRRALPRSLRLKCIHHLSSHTQEPNIALASSNLFSLRSYLWLCNLWLRVLSPLAHIVPETEQKNIGLNHSLRQPGLSKTRTVISQNMTSAAKKWEAGKIPITKITISDRSSKTDSTTSTPLSEPYDLNNTQSPKRAQNIPIHIAHPPLKPFSP